MMLAVVSVAGCRSDSRSARSSTLTVLYDADEAVLGPQWDEPTKFMVFLPLVEQQEDGGMTGRLLSRWEQSPDYRTYTMHLRPGLRWHDGVPVTARDIEFTLDLISQPHIGYRTGHVTVIDDSTYTLTVDTPAEGTPDNDWTVYYPKHRLHTLDASRFFSWEFWKQPVGNGPYRYHRHVPKTFTELRANPGYYEGRPRIERIILKFGTGVSPIVELLSGAVDAATVRPLDVPKLQQDDRFRVYRSFSWNVHTVLFWNQQHSALADVRVRRALTHAVDRPSLHVLLGFGDGVPVFDVPPSSTEFRSGDFPAPVPYDTVAARALLREAGYDPVARPLKLTVLVTGGIAEQAAVVLQSQLSRVGVQLQVAPVEFATHWQRIRDGNYDAAIATAINNAAYMFSYNRLLGEESPLRFRHTSAARLVKERVSQLDPIERQRIESGLTRIIMREQPFTILYPNVTFTVAHRRVRGLSSPWRTDPVWFAHRLWLED